MHLEQCGFRSSHLILRILFNLLISLITIPVIDEGTGHVLASDASRSNFLQAWSELPRTHSCAFHAYLYPCAPRRRIRLGEGELSG
jgi:hypothetical protein